MGDLIVGFDVGELAGGAIGMVLGAEYSHSSFDQLNDPESNAFLIAGSAGGDNINAEEQENLHSLRLAFHSQSKSESAWLVVTTITTPRWWR